MISPCLVIYVYIYISIHFQLGFFPYKASTLGRPHFGKTPTFENHLSEFTTNIRAFLLLDQASKIVLWDHHWWV